MFLRNCFVVYIFSLILKLKYHLCDIIRYRINFIIKTLHYSLRSESKTKNNFKDLHFPQTHIILHMYYILKELIAIPIPIYLPI